MISKRTLNNLRAQSPQFPEISPIGHTSIVISNGALRVLSYYEDAAK